MGYWMGIDGGGSTLRIVIVDDSLKIISHVERKERTNPGGTGYETAARIIQNAMLAAVVQAGVDLSGVGIGIAGASAIHSETWLRELVAGVQPDVFAAPSSDHEIALVGAVGERRGILLLSGTGSVAYGVNEAGEALQVGGWGYLMGDEGSGYWIGLEALRTVIRQFDETHDYRSTLAQAVLDTLMIKAPRDLVRWLYGDLAPRTREVASLAPVVLETANTDARAAQIIEEAAQSLYGLATALMSRLTMPNPPMAFGGGLLTSDNILSRRMCDLLALPEQPTAQYTPVVGAALLAKLRKEGQA